VNEVKFFQLPLPKDLANLLFGVFHIYPYLIDILRLIYPPKPETNTQDLCDLAHNITPSIGNQL
jgi:hypothetical protein